MQKKLITEPIVKELADITGKTIKKVFEHVEGTHHNDNRLYLMFTDSSCCVIESSCDNGCPTSMELEEYLNEEESLALGMITKKEYDKIKSHEEARDLNNRLRMNIRDEKELLRELNAKYPDVLKKK